MFCQGSRLMFSQIKMTNKDVFVTLKLHGGSMDFIQSRHRWKLPAVHWAMRIHKMTSQDMHSLNFRRHT